MALQDNRAVLVATADSDSDGLQDLAAAGAARRRRRAVVGGAVAVGAASALVLWRSLGHCKVGVDLEDSVVSLAETYPQDLAQLAEADDDLDSRSQWLAEATEASRKLQQGLPSGASLPEDVQQALDAAMQSDDPDQARKVLDRAMTRAIEESKAKRNDLKSYIKRNRRGLKGKKKDDAISPGKQQAIATCVFDVLSATTTVAGIAANMNDAAKTCWGVHAKDLFRFGLHGKAYVHTNVCSVNVWATLGGIIGLSSTLSSAASDCASTMIPNIDAMCASSITGVVTAVAGMGGASTLIKAACARKGWYHDIMPGTVPSNVGNNRDWVDRHPEHKSRYEAEMAERAAAGSVAGARRLEEGPAPARQLLFGGGKGSTATQCSVEIAQTMWALTFSAFAINNMGNQETGQSCPPTNFLTGSERPSNSILYTVPQALCTVDVTSAILGFLSSATYIQLAVVNCIDTLNLGAICGAGITGLMSAADGVAKAGAGLYIACDIAQKKPIKHTVNLARNIDTATGGMISGLMGGTTGDAGGSPFGRRLTEDQQLMVSIVEENIKELQKRFETPHDALLSIGVDLEDKHAPWRNATAPGMPNMNELQGLAELLQKPKKTQSLFGGETC